MRLAIVEVIPLVGEDDAVLLGLVELVGQPSADMLVVVGIAVRQGRHFEQLGAEQPQCVFLFLALRFRNDDQRAIAARAGDQRQPDAGIAGGGFDHQAAGPQFAALFRLEDHLAAGAVFHRTARIHELGLAEDGAGGQLRRAFELDQRCMADRIHSVVS